MSEPKWTMERIHKEISEARTKIFVVAKVLETGSLSFSENNEWALVVRPILKDLIANTELLSAMVEGKQPAPQQADAEPAGPCCGKLQS